jgi:predicted kinase
LQDQQEAEVDDDKEQIIFTDWDTEHAEDAYRRQVELAAQSGEKRVQAEIEAESELEAERHEAARKKAEEVVAEARRQRMLRKKAKKEQKVRLESFESEEF